MGENGHAFYGRFRLPSNPTCMFTRKSGFCREMLLHTSALTQGPSHRDGLKKEIFYKGTLPRAGALTQRCFQHRDAFTHRCFRRQILLHRDDFAKRKF